MLEESEETVAQKTEQFQPLYSEEVFNMVGQLLLRARLLIVLYLESFQRFQQ